MRFGITAFFLLTTVGCTSGSEEPSPKIGDGTVAAADSRSESSSVTTANATPSDSPRTAETAHIAAKRAASVSLDPLGASCPFPASTCSGPCVPVTGVTFDNANQCLSSSVVVGCLHKDSQIATDVTCFKRRQDGVLLGTSLTLRDKLGSDWGACPLDEQGALFGHVVCQ